MKYGKTAWGDRWHMLVKRSKTSEELSVLCGPSSLKVVETNDSPPSWLICGNCDSNLRDKGKAMMPKPPAPSKADYKPRHKFED